MSFDPHLTADAAWGELDPDEAAVADRRRIAGIPTIVMALCACALAARIGVILLFWPDGRTVEQFLTAPHLGELLASFTLVPAAYLLSRRATEAAGPSVSHAAGVTAAGFVAYWPALVAAPATDNTSLVALAALALAATVTTLQRSDRARGALVLTALGAVAASILILAEPLAGVAAALLVPVILLRGRNRPAARLLAAAVFLAGSAATYALATAPTVPWPIDLPTLARVGQAAQAAAWADADRLAAAPAAIGAIVAQMSPAAVGTAGLTLVASLLAVATASQRGWTMSSTGVTALAMLWVAVAADSVAALTAATAMGLACVGWLIGAVQARHRAQQVRSPMVRSYLARRLSNDGH